jgi:hypothetical protein
MLKSYKTIVFHYPTLKIEIDFNGKNVFKVYTVDVGGNRDVEPIDIIREKLLENSTDSICVAQIVCDNWIKRNLYEI